MADDREAAERERLIREIDRLKSAISRASIEHDNLVEELAFVISAIAALTASAQSMSEVVTRDVGHLTEEVAKEEVDARDLLQELRDLSEKYFKYKNLSTATRKVTQFVDEYHTRYSYYHELRRIALGCVMAVDANLISHETARRSVEKAYLANTDYWLSYAIAAVMLWWSDEREAADRAMRRALLMDQRKSALLFLFCTLKLGRKESAARWYSYYLGSIHANDVGPEYQYLLEAYLCGSLDSARKLEATVGERFEGMFSEIALYNINYAREVADYARNFLETKAHVSDFDFFYLAEYCTDVGRMRYLINSAEKNDLVARDLQELAAQEPSSATSDERLEESIYNLLESMDPEEEKIYLQIKHNELIVAARGDMTIAKRAYEERFPEKAAVSLGDLMKTWAFAENDPRVLPEVRDFAFGRLASDIRAGFRQFADAYHAEERERFEIKLGDWSFTCNENELDIARANYGEFYDSHKLADYLNDRFVRIWLVMIVAGILAILISAATVPSATFIVSGVLLVLVGGFLLWRQVEDVQATLAKRKEKDLDIIGKTLEEMGSWRAAYHRADEGVEALAQATHLFED